MIPKFQVGERLTHINSLVDYRVIETPATCIVNDRPAYVLKMLNAAITAPFHTYQDHVEEAWRSWSMAFTFRFAIGSTIRHKKTGGIYTVVLGPDKGRLETSDTPAYSYSGSDGLVWHRSQEEMEDGRFELYIPSGEPPKSIAD